MVLRRLKKKWHCSLWISVLILTLAIAPPARANPFQDIFEMLQLDHLWQYFSGLQQQLQGWTEEFWESEAGETLTEVLEGIGAISDLVGAAGTLDPLDTAAAILDAIMNRPQGGSLGDPMIPDTVEQQGTEATLVGRAVSQSTLGKEGQQQQKDRTEMIIEGTEAANETAQLVGDELDSISLAAHAVASSADSSWLSAEAAGSEAEAVVGHGVRAQTLTATQDVLKAMALQQAGMANVMASVSNQMGTAADQTRQLSNQFLSHGNQKAGQAVVQATQAKLAGVQAVTLQQILEQSATQNLLMTELHTGLKGDRQAQLIREQAEVNQLNQLNSFGFRLLR